LLSMPAVAEDIATHKLITVLTTNAAKGLPTIQGHLSVIEPLTGQTRMILDGPTVTGRRTAVLSILAMNSLQHAKSKQLLIIGTGTQAQHHVEAIAALCPDVAVSVRGSSGLSTERFCRRNSALSGNLSPETGSNVFDVVITCTSSRNPVYCEPASTNRLIIATGAFQQDTAEISAPTVRCSALYVDDIEGAQREAGDLIGASVSWADVNTLADAILHGTPATEPVLFKSVGCAAWDLAAARVAVSKSSLRASRS
jgi:1-piperideine-2-carboxylate/1-pyrroline-2-carboxylate reductase [NAD(P)H]